MDKGAIKFLFSGSDIMCKGLTSSGGLVEDDLDEGDLVAVMAEGKENALAIGRMVMSGAEMYVWTNSSVMHF